MEADELLAWRVTLPEPESCCCSLLIVAAVARPQLARCRIATGKRKLQSGDVVLDFGTANLMKWQGRGSLGYQKTLRYSLHRRVHQTSMKPRLRHNLGSSSRSLLAVPRVRACA